MVNLTIQQTDVDALSDHIKANRGGVDASVQSTFCKDWPAVKAGLQLLEQVLSSVPGVSIFASMAINLVIAAGDAAAGAICGHTP